VGKPLPIVVSESRGNRKRLVQIALPVAENGEIMQGLSCIRMLLPQVLFAEREDALIKSFCLRVLIPISKEIRQAIERIGHIQMLRSQRLLPDL